MLPPVTEPAMPIKAVSAVLGSVLEVQANILSQLLARPDRYPPRWRAPGFGRQVDLVRTQLAPIHSHESLARSYAREHFQIDRSGTAPPSPEGLLRRSSTDVAYAHRWLELSGRLCGGPWISLLGEP